MNTRFTKNAKIFDICITAVAGMVSVCVMLYGVAQPWASRCCCATFSLHHHWSIMHWNCRVRSSQWHWSSCLPISMHVRTGRATPSATCGPSASLTCSLPRSITWTSIWSLPTNTPLICSRRSGFVLPSPMVSWPAS